MTKSIEMIRKALLSLFTSALVVGLLFVVGCDNGDDDPPEPELYDLAGVYTFKKAELVSGKEAIADAIGIPAALIPTDITDEMASGLLNEAPCDNPENGAVELKSNNELFFACIGETNEEKTGTWEVNSDTTELDLNLAVMAGNLQLTLENLEIDETNDVISGSIINFPLTPDLVAGFFPPGTSQELIDAILADLPAAIPVNVDIEFQKVT